MSDRSHDKIVQAVRETTLWDASVTGEQTLNLLALADQAATQGNAEEALRLLEGFASWDKSEIHRVLIEHRNDFTAVGIPYHREPVPEKGQGRYDSVHKLMMMLWPEMRFRLLDPAWEVPDKLLESLGLEDLTEIHEGLNREREKLRLLLSQAAATKETAKPDGPMPSGASPLDTGEAVTPSPMISKGERNYAVGNQTRVVEDTEDTVLQVFFDRAGQETDLWIALEQKELIDGSGVSTAARVLKKMKSKYPDLAPAIDCPGIKGRGGLKVFVASRQKNREK